MVVEPWIDGLWQALDNCPNVTRPRKIISKIEETKMDKSEHVDLVKSDDDSGEMDQLLKQLYDVTLSDR